MQELINAFSLERVSKSGARFQPDKAKWFNAQYMHRKSDAELAALYQPILRAHGIEVTDEVAGRAAGIMKEYGCSDDGFIDFRAWLIAQGREVYFAALADPDSLADVVPYGDCCFEQLSYVGDYVYEQLTGKSAYDQTDWSAYEALLMKLEQDIVYKDGIEFPREGADLKKYLPRLCAKHPEWDGQTRWNLQLKEIRDLIHAGKDYDRRQTSNKKKRSRGGEAR